MRFRQGSSLKLLEQNETMFRYKMRNLYAYECKDLERSKEQTTLKHHHILMRRPQISPKKSKAIDGTRLIAAITEATAAKRIV